MILTSLTRCNFFGYVLWTKDYMNSHMVADSNYREKRSSAVNKKKKKKRQIFKHQLKLYI